MRSSGMQLGMPSLPNLLKEGYKHFSGVEEAVMRNVEACKKLSKITRTSLGPNGMNKMVINHLEKLFVTNDASTIMNEMEVVHPAAKMLVMAAQMQEKEIGDGTNFVLAFGGELLNQVESLLQMGLHPSEIVSGYTLASAKALEILDELTVENIELSASNANNSQLIQRGIRSAISSKQYGYEDLLCPLVAEACMVAMPRNPANFVVDNVRVCKVLGGRVADSQVIKGLIVQRDAEGSVKKIENAKVAVYGCSIESAQTETKMNVLINDAEGLMNYSQSEEEYLEKTIKAISDSGVKVIVSSGNFHEMAMHFIEKYKMMAVRIPSKFELRRLCRAVGARASVSLEVPQVEDLGHVDVAYVTEVGETKLTVFRQNVDGSQIGTVLLRSSTQSVLDDLERAVDDGVNVVRMMGKDGRFVSGAGASEVEIARRLAAFASQIEGLEQYAVKKFAEAFEVFPTTLAENLGIPTSEIMANLYAAHENGEPDAGIDIENRGISQNGILDLLVTKRTALRLASDAAITILRVDQIIMAKPAGGPKVKQPGANWDED